jgi:hypothetical protein
MAINIDSVTKARIVKYGPVRTFGDYDKRQRMSEGEMIAVFDQAWDAGLQGAVNRSHPCTIDVARPKLKENFRSFLDPRQEQRQFRYQEMDFIAQLKRISESEQELTQLWKIQSGDDHPKTLWVTFDSIEERQEFAAVAHGLGWDDEELGLELLRDFMTKIKRPTSK